jgi:prephenate dehydratase
MHGRYALGIYKANSYQMKSCLYLGPNGSFSHQAALSLSFVSALEAAPDVRSIVQSVENGDATYGLVPIENSVDGEVTAHIDEILFRTSRCLVTAEVVVPVAFFAFTVDPAVTPTVAISHPVALAQCQNYIRQGRMTTEATTSTSAACELISKAGRLGVVALASEIAGKIHGLHLYEEHVEDNSRAHTKFYVLSRSLDSSSATTRCRTWIAIVPPSNRTGVLAEIMTYFAERGIGIHAISTRPLRADIGAYCFLLTVEGWINSTAIMAALSDVIRIGSSVRVLGSFPEWQGEGVTPSILSLGGIAPDGNAGFGRTLPEVPVV